jgi:hypothetical protein
MPVIRERVVSHLLNVDDTLADAFAHRKFIGHVKAAVPLFEEAGIAETDFDEGIIALASSKDVSGFVGKLGQLRVWSREPRVKMRLGTHRHFRAGFAGRELKNVSSRMGRFGSLLISALVTIALLFMFGMPRF